VNPAGARILNVSIQPKPKKTIVSRIATESIKKPDSRYSNPIPEDPSQRLIDAALMQSKFHNFSGP
jgi:hypothetical protein